MEISILAPGDEAVFDNVEAGVFDHPLSARLWRLATADRASRRRS